MALLKKIDRTRPDHNSAVMITAMLRILLEHFGPEKTAEYYLDALESTRYSDDVLSGLYVQAGLPGEYAGPARMMAKDGGWTREQHEQYEQDHSEHRKIVLKALAADLAKTQDKFNAEAKAYDEMLRKAFHD